MTKLPPLTWTMRGGDMHPQAFLDWLPYCEFAAEIGVYSGELSELLLDSGKVGALVCVDDWKDRGELHSCYDHMRTVEAHFDARMERFGRRCVKVKADCTAAASVLTNYFNLVYLDTTHDFESTYDAIEVWQHHVTDNCILAGHDYVAYAGVTEAVNQQFGCPDHLFTDTTWAVSRHSPSDISATLAYLKLRFPEPKQEG